MASGSTPDEDSDNLIFLEDELAETVSSLTSRTEQMLVIQQGMGDLPIGGGFGSADLK